MAVAIPWTTSDVHAQISTVCCILAGVQSDMLTRQRWLLHDSSSGLPANKVKRAKSHVAIRIWPQEATLNHLKLSVNGVYSCVVCRSLCVPLCVLHIVRQLESHMHKYHTGIRKCVF